MTVRAAAVIIIIICTSVILIEYIQRGEFAVGTEWLLPIVACIAVPLREDNDR